MANGGNNTGSNSGGSTGSNSGSTMTNSEKQKKAAELKKQIQSFCNQDLSKKTVQEIKDCLSDIFTYKNEYNGVLDENMTINWNALNGELEKRGEEKDDRLFKTQVNSKGDEVVDGEVVETHKNDEPVLGQSTSTADHNIDEVLNEANGFIQKADGAPINTNALQTASNTVYNIMLTIGIVATVLVGTYLALKFMFSSVEEQAKVKESLIPYIVGCVVIFGAFIIWKIAIILLKGIA